MTLFRYSSHGSGRDQRPRKAFPKEMLDAWDALTPREKEIVELTAQGWKVKQIATRLGIEAGTVEAHRHNIAEKTPGDGTPQSKIQRMYAVICGASTEGLDL